MQKGTDKKRYEKEEQIGDQKSKNGKWENKKHKLRFWTC